MENAPIKVSGITLPAVENGQKQFVTVGEVIDKLVGHAVSQAIAIGFRVLGSNPNFGNPNALIESTQNISHRALADAPAAPKALPLRTTAIIF